MCKNNIINQTCISKSNKQKNISGVHWQNEKNKKIVRQNGLIYELS